VLLEAVGPDLLDVPLRDDPARPAGERAVEREEVRPRLAQREPHAGRPDDGDLAHLLVQQLALGALEAELHVLGGERIAVVELHAFPQLELVDALVRTHRPRLRQARRQHLAGHGLHEGVVQRVEHPERREDADDLGRIEPHRRQRHVEREAHLALGLRLRARRRPRAAQRRGDEQAGEDRHRRAPRLHREAEYTARPRDRLRA